MKRLYSFLIILSLFAMVFSAPVTIKYGDATAKVDELKGGLVTIPVEHYELHKGDSYYGFMDTALTSASGDSLKLLLWDSTKTRDDIHTTFTVYSNSGSGTFDIFESDTNIFAGSALVLYNRNRISSNVTGWKFYKNVTLNGGKTLIYHGEFGASTAAGGSSRGGATRSEYEFILNNQKRYLIICHVTANSTNLNVEVNYYE